MPKRKGSVSVISISEGDEHSLAPRAAAARSRHRSGSISSSSDGEPLAKAVSRPGVDSPGHILAVQMSSLELPVTPTKSSGRMSAGSPCDADAWGMDACFDLDAPLVPLTPTKVPTPKSARKAIAKRKPPKAKKTKAPPTMPEYSSWSVPELQVRLVLSRRAP